MTMWPLPFAKYFKFHVEVRDACSTHSTPLKKLRIDTRYESWRHSSLQEIANILHIMAKKRHTICLLPELERQAEAISGEFNSQQLAKMRLIFDTFILVFYLQIMHVTVDGSAK